MPSDRTLVDRFHRVLVEEILLGAPTYLEAPFTVAEIYQSLIPYRTHRDRLGVEINGDYEDTLLRLLAGEGDFLHLESEAARGRIRKELEQGNPNTGIYREFAAVSVRLNPLRLPERNGGDRGGAPRSEPVETTLFTPPPAEVAPAAAPRPAAARSSEAMPEPGAPSQCPECAEALPTRERVHFCPSCGANLRLVPCGECGEVLERSWRFCVNCGASAKR